MTRTARCCCEACEFAVDGEPVLNAVCHCDNCKRRTGSAFGWSAYFLDANVVSESGQLSVYETKGATPARRFFCAACGTTLFWRSEVFMPGHTGVAGGCFTATPLPEPGLTATDAKRCAWLGLPPSWIAVS